MLCCSVVHNITNHNLAQDILCQALDNPDARFRDGQWESIEALLNNQRALVVQRTGWGKSMVYFLATKLLRNNGRGPTLLISPLLSLMRNQIAAAHRIGLAAQTINSGNVEEWGQVWADLGGKGQSLKLKNGVTNRPEADDVEVVPSACGRNIP